MRRRPMLAAVGGGFLSLAGCSNPLRRDTVLLDLVEVANFDESRPHDIHVRIVEGGRTVYDEAHRLERAGGGVVAPSVVIEDDLPDDPGAFELVAKYTETPEWERMDVADCATTDCTHVYVIAFDSRRLGVTCTDTCFGDERGRSAGGQSVGSSGVT